MRISFKKVVKIIIIIFTLGSLNCLICYKLQNFGDTSKKVFVHPRHDNGDLEDVVLDHSAGQALKPAGSDGQSWLQNRATTQQTFHLIEKVKTLAPFFEISTDGSDKKLTSKLATSQQLSHARRTELSDVFISVKTTGRFHGTRLQLVLQTWFLLAKEQTHFFTDIDDEDFNKATGGKMVNTNCSSSHNRQSLCCKMSVEFDAYLESKKRWMCHFDDDTYVNIPMLVELLQQYKHTDDWYLGKPSLRHPIEITDVDHPGIKIAFWFATGSGFCISRGLALKMMPHAGGGRLMTLGEKIRLPDDCVVGYIIDHLLRRQLTVVEEFRSHLEALWLIKPSEFSKQITFSYSKYGDKLNVVNVAGFSMEEDPTRMKSIHCSLFPTFRECRKIHP